MISFEPLLETMKKGVSQFQFDSRDAGTTALFHHEEMRLSFRWSRPWASGSAHWPRTSSAVDGRFSWVSKGVRVASGDLKMQRILKHLTELTGERQQPFGTRLCLQSLVCYTLVPADAEKGLREVPASTCSVAEGCADGHGS